MSNDRFWFGFLEAGDKSSPVLCDDKIATNNPNTIYLYNLQRGAIIEYKRSLVEPKLRELKKGEQALTEELAAGYAVARSSFTPKGGRLSIPERGATRSPAPIQAEEEEEEAVTDIDDEDADWEDDDSED